MKYACIILFAATMPVMALGAPSPQTHSGASPQAQPAYPKARRDDTVNTYFGTKVPAPYQWMENLDSPELHK